jgi:hypothetical protein
MPRAEIVVVSVAVQDAPAVAVGAANTHTVRPPIVVEPIVNWTPPLGHCVGHNAALLFDDTLAVNVTTLPDVIVLGLAVTAIDVAAFVIITVSVGDMLPVKLLSPA